MGNVCAKATAKNDQPFHDPSKLEASEQSVEPAIPQGQNGYGEEVGTTATVRTPDQYKAQQSLPRAEAGQQKSGSWEAPVAEPNTEEQAEGDQECQDIQDIDVQLEEVTELSDIPSDAVTPRRPESTPSTPGGDAGPWKPTTVNPPCDSSPLENIKHKSIQFRESSNRSDSPALQGMVRQGSISDLSDPGEYETYGTRESMDSSTKFSPRIEEEEEPEVVRVNPMFANQETQEEESCTPTKSAGSVKTNELQGTAPSRAATHEKPRESQENWDDSAPTSPAEEESQGPVKRNIWEGIWDASDTSSRVVKQTTPVLQDVPEHKQNGTSIPASLARTNKKESFSDDDSGSVDSPKAAELSQAREAATSTAPQRPSDSGSVEPEVPYESAAPATAVYGTDPVEPGKVVMLTPDTLPDSPAALTPKSSVDPGPSVQTSSVVHSAAPASPIATPTPSAIPTPPPPVAEKPKPARSIPSYMQATKSSSMKLDSDAGIAPAKGRSSETGEAQKAESTSERKVAPVPVRSQTLPHKAKPAPDVKAPRAVGAKSELLTSSSARRPERSPPRSARAGAASSSSLQGVTTGKRVSATESTATSTIQQPSAAANPAAIIAASTSESMANHKVAAVPPVPVPVQPAPTAANDKVQNGSATVAQHPDSGDGAALTTSASLRKPQASGGLPHGQWRLVRLKKPMACDACNGTTQQETVDGELEVFKCDVSLNPGQLAAVVYHDFFLEDGTNSNKPKTWVFCPDPLCLDSNPVGSALPKWPAQFQLEGATKITRTEYTNLKEIGVDILIPTKATETPAA